MLTDEEQKLPISIITPITWEQFEQLPVWQQQYVLKRLELIVRQMYPERFATKASVEQLEQAVMTAMRNATPERMGESLLLQL